MSRLTRSEIETLIDDLIVAHPIYTPQLRALREQSLSQEAARDEALEEAANLQVHEANELETAAAYAKRGPPYWTLKRLAKECLARADSIRALKREPNAVAESYEAVHPKALDEPAPAAPDVTGMVKLAEDYLSLKRTLISGDEIVKLARAFILLAKARSLR